MSLRSAIVLAGLTLAGAGSQAIAGPISTGTVSYNYSGNTPDGTCSSTSREDFVGSVVDIDESIDGSLNFSVCSDPGAFNGGTFTLTTGDGTASGTVTASDLGDVYADGVDTESLDGTFVITTASGSLSSIAGYTDGFQATIAENLSTGAGSGTFSVGETPEPGTLAIGSLGMLCLIGLLKTRSRSTVQ